ncbi:valine--tRNA ligase [soil metagenome]
MELSKNYIPTETENKWYSHWLEKKYFNSTPDNREPYTIVIPPPNVTGVLHMGHCLNNSIQDILARYHRMNGKNVCWIPGTDHASIATEAKVVGMLRERGITKSSLSRDKFLGYAWEWKEKYGGIILQQMKKLGCSLDWDRVNFTMDDDYYKSVISVFVDLYHKGLIYRGKRMINWDTKALTALSDEEVIFRDTNSKLYYLNYKVEGSDGSPLGDGGITIATVRPETILGDTAICVNPADERYNHLHGKCAFVPLINRRIPIIVDEYVTMEFGTGALKVTPAHDMNDYQLGQKHGLEVIDIMNDNGTFSESAQILIGEDRFEARKKIIPLLEEAGAIVKIEDYPNQVGYSERNPDTAVEPRLSLQWWVKMKPLAEPALKVVEDGDIKFHPAKFVNTYRHWMGNIKDWCISRQLWWGHRIPAWYDKLGNYFVAKNEEEAIQQYRQKNPKSEIINPKLRQDEDCLDTWFSSWLWPFEVFKGYSNPGNKEVEYYYPTDTLVTAPEIIFFWVARMIMAGLEYKKEIPFKDVYFTGIVRDMLGRKMSKSLGNSPELLGLIDQYGADAVRFGIMIASPAGNDLLFDESSLEQGRNFNNKLWNALKLVKMWEGRQVNIDNESNDNFAVTWFENRLNEARAEVDGLIQQFRLSEALKTIYSLIWDDFCSWYLEWVKPGFEQPIDKAIYEKTVAYFEQLLQLLHPYMPFISEEIYHLLKEQQDDLCVKQFPALSATNTIVLAEGEILKKVISAIRDARNKNQVKPKDVIKLRIQTDAVEDYQPIENILAKQVNAESIHYTKEAITNTIVVAVEKDKFFIESEKELDAAVLKEELLKDLAHQQDFLQSVIKKLSNERFVHNAKAEVVELERKKQADAEARIKTIEESLQNLN